ncbi:hypothetical protein [Duganella sp. Dugasp56]|uniref:hypothetical protein n=1 Tax=Duganella sp. Dugasp56 TaxID=3243046 RepID=UPI0039AEE46B
MNLFIKILSEMARNIMSNTVKTPKFIVIQGGKSSGQPESVEPAVNHFHSSDNSPSALESNRLRRAILSLRVAEVGETVEDILDEISDKLDTGEDYDFSRGIFIKDQLEVYGLRFCLARPEMNLVREGYLMLCWPDRLLRKYPELAELHPLAHQSLTLG